jgi:hypothetical protein
MVPPATPPCVVASTITSASVPQHVRTCLSASRRKNPLLDVVRHVGAGRELPTTTTLLTCSAMRWSTTRSSADRFGDRGPTQRRPITVQVPPPHRAHPR